MKLLDILRAVGLWGDKEEEVLELAYRPPNRLDVLRWRKGLAKRQALDAYAKFCSTSVRPHSQGAKKAWENYCRAKAAYGEAAVKECSQEKRTKTKRHHIKLLSSEKWTLTLTPLAIFGNLGTLNNGVQGKGE